LSSLYIGSSFYATRVFIATYSAADKLVLKSFAFCCELLFDLMLRCLGEEKPDSIINYDVGKVTD
jgi:hypothetical protein